MKSHSYGVSLLWSLTTMESHYYGVIPLFCYTTMDLHSYVVILLWGFTTMKFHYYLLNTMVFLYSYIGNIHYLFSLRRTSNITFHKSMISKPIIALICSKCFNHNLHFCICIVCKGKC